MTKVINIALFNAAIIFTALALGGGHAEVSLGQPAQKPRPKFISGQATAHPNSTNINFEEGVINGAPKSPVGTEVGATTPNRNYDFVKVRLRWHPEMLQSAGSINQ